MLIEEYVKQRVFKGALLCTALNDVIWLMHPSNDTFIHAMAWSCLLGNTHWHTMTFGSRCPVLPYNHSHWRYIYCWPSLPTGQTVLWVHKLVVLRLHNVWLSSAVECQSCQHNVSEKESIKDEQ